ncbi:MAG: hypothetical protein RBU37_26130 [Myxococcota bacterium]|jgi:hypothetical protein|nr:hypothetical protein [Myxococcota bacterium]
MSTSHTRRLRRGAFPAQSPDLALLRAIPGTHPSGCLRSESPPPGYDFCALTKPAARATWRSHSA